MDARLRSLHGCGRRMVAWHLNTTEKDLYADFRDAAGVAWVRASYLFEGARRVKDLTLYAGTPADGQWRFSFPLGNQVRR